MLHVKSLKLKIPWFNWSAGVDIELVSLLVVVRPLASDHWSLEEVRTHKEQEPTLTLALLLAPSTHPDPDPHSHSGPHRHPRPHPHVRHACVPGLEAKQNAARSALLKMRDEQRAEEAKHADA